MTERLLRVPNKSYPFPRPREAPGRARGHGSSFLTPQGSTCWMSGYPGLPARFRPIRATGHAQARRWWSMRSTSITPRRSSPAPSRRRLCSSCCSVQRPRTQSQAPTCWRGRALVSSTAGARFLSTNLSARRFRRGRGAFDRQSADRLAGAIQARPNWRRTRSCSSGKRNPAKPSYRDLSGFARFLPMRHSTAR